MFRTSLFPGPASSPASYAEGMAADENRVVRFPFTDDMLYVTAGDTGDRSAAQDRDSLAGKTLRLTPDGSVPEDNPFADSLVYSLGHRNPQGLGWADDRTLYASEFGQDTWDELNVIESGANYEWPEVEGIGGEEEFVDPVQQREPAAASLSGLAVSGDSIVIANLRGERVWEVPVSNLEQSTAQLRGDHGRLRDVAEGDDRVVRVPVE